jgi:hypothetical protein
MTYISSWAISSAKPCQSESYLDDLLVYLHIQLRSGDGEKPSYDIAGRANLKLPDEESGRWRIEQKSMRNCLYLIVKVANYCFLHNNQLNGDGQTSTVLGLAESDRSSLSSSLRYNRKLFAKIGDASDNEGTSIGPSMQVMVSVK